MLKMDEINKIRKAFFSQGKTKNAIAKRFNRSWDTIHRIVTTPREELENRGKRPGREPSISTAEVEQAINAYLDDEIEKKVRKKQRYTVRKIYKELKSKGIYKGSERRIYDLVRKIRNERNQTKKKSYLPLTFPLGSALQIDHGEVDLVINNSRVKGYLFIASVPEHVLRYCQIFPVKSSEAWGEFHERALHFFGGVFPRVIYDNDTVLVKKILGDTRHQTNFSLALEEHYGFESHFCNLAAGNEKGSVENGVGYCRRNYLPGLPEFIDWNESNKYLLECSNRDIYEEKHYKTDEPLKNIFESLKQKLEPLSRQKAWCKWEDGRVDSCQLVSINSHEYSVPEKFVGAGVRIALGIFELRIFKNEELIATHKRQFGSDDSLILDHYLDQLEYKSSAFWDCKAVSKHKFDHQILEIWYRLSEKYLKKEANRQFVKILLLGRRYSQENLLKSIKLALKYGAIDHSSVENIIRQFDVDELIFNKKELDNALKSIDIQSYQFDISPYAELCCEVKL